ncbi:TPA: hypothetical protein K8250_002541 [Escherichia coli]|uniref:cyclic GMP-AMP synthase DncV-like nucleotidyltransferase n=1 Tax=Escherichia coli TaxID=562 RepID=UPI000BE1FE2A|nr:hypothetical protein [Escherichia coli]EFH3111142.1 hypothetical protein [Escherichia coli]EFH3136424.1 hypothetical protein [Escherichia coli]EFH3531425.1 hypothetical protein [Escherichia coli]EFH6519082.1 hypothetical protein [Escherichia coli]EFH6577492.1 hypothetical protein [Escherichia coli]
MNCNELFYSADNHELTLHERTKLSTVVLDKGITKKNELIEFLREELKGSFGCDVKFWLQGSYKSHTLIKPVDKFSSYDIDVGIYLFFDAEAEEINSKDVKDTLKDALLSYCEINNEAKIQESKNACEGLIFSSFLTIDTPIYYKTTTKVKLATDKGWSDSDPKAIQDWLTNSHATKPARALMKRLVRYFKAWVNVQWHGTSFKKIPSLAINVLVANNLSIHDREDDCFIYTVLAICEQLERSMEVENPLNGTNLLAMPDDALTFAHQKLQQLKKVCIDCIDANENERNINFSNLFQHYFPQVTIVSNGGGTGLPAITTTPEISVCRYDKHGSHIETVLTDQLTVDKGDSLTFTICNPGAFSPYAQTKWTVRNVGSQANDANDIGHIEYGKPNESHKRGTSYTGSHTMECMVTYNGAVLGLKVIQVIVRPAISVKRPIRKFWR